MLPKTKQKTHLRVTAASRKPYGGGSRLVDSALGTLQGHPIPPSGEFGLRIFCLWYRSSERSTHPSCRGENGLVLAQTWEDRFRRGKSWESMARPNLEQQFIIFLLLWHRTDGVLHIHCLGHTLDYMLLPEYQPWPTCPPQKESRSECKCWGWKFEFL